MTFLAPSDFELTVNGDTIQFLTAILQTLGREAKISGFLTKPATDKAKTQLILFWSQSSEPGYTSFPISKPESLAHFIYSWLDNLDTRAFGPDPDIDGSIKRGWHMHVASHLYGYPRYAKIVITPCYTEYHK